MVPFKQDKEILSTGFLTRLNEGIEVLRLDIRYPEVQRIPRIVFTIWVMLTIGSTRDYAIDSKGIVDRDNETQDFIDSLGYSQLYAYFELEHDPNTPVDGFAQQSSSTPV